MARIVAVHGIAQELLGPETLEATWLPALRDGLALAGGPRIADDEFTCAFYGDLFRKPGERAAASPALTAASVTSDDERELLALWWHEAARLDPTVVSEPKVEERTPLFVQQALNDLSKIPFFAGLAERAMVWDLKQVVAYLNDPVMRQKIRGRVSAALGPETQVVIGHSLGSVVAYEALCRFKASRVRSFVTLGSPLGIRNVIFDKLDPSPVNGKGAWPPVTQWYNIADTGDVVALVKRLAPLFGDVRDSLVNNGAHAHDVVPYLTAVETGRAVASGLTG